MDIEEKINKICESQYLLIKDVSDTPSNKNKYIDLFKTLDRHNCVTYEDIIKTLEEAKIIASMITTL